MTIPAKGHLLVYVSTTESGTFLAATNEPPYFCFEADTEEALKPLIGEAISLCLKNRGTASQSSFV